MKLAIMQPYLFPYIGYFQLINSVDIFVIYDDVQYRKGGWINRNRILLQNKPYLFTFSLKTDSYSLLINQRYFSDNFSYEKNKFLTMIKQEYIRAPYFTQVYNLLQEIFQNEENNIALMITDSLRKICNYLDIRTKFMVSSQIRKDDSLKNEAKVIDINQRLGSNQYINLIGGRILYSEEEFLNHNIQLKFLKLRDIVYKQFSNEFIPSLSIIDILMFNSLDEIKKLLKEYELL